MERRDRERRRRRQRVRLVRREPRPDDREQRHARSATRHRSGHPTTHARAATAGGSASGRAACAASCRARRPPSGVLRGDRFVPGRVHARARPFVVGTERDLDRDLRAALVERDRAPRMERAARRRPRAGSPARRPADRRSPHPGRRRAARACTGGSDRTATTSAGPSSTMRPRYITAIRSATMRAAARSWVTNNSAMPSWRRSRPSRLSTVAASETSSAEVGSSHSRTSGGTTVDAGERDALALPAGELTHLRVRDLGQQTDEAERVRDPLRALLAGQSLLSQALADELADGQPGRERRAGILEHHLRARASSEHDLAAVDRHQARDRAQQRRLPAAALADERKRPALGNRQVHAAERLERLPSCESPRAAGTSCGRRRR